MDETSDPAHGPQLPADPRPSQVSAPAGPGPLDALPDPLAVIFDLDGTLVDTVGHRIDAWLATFAEVGIPADRTHVAGLIGADGKRLAREVAEVAGRTIHEDKAEAIDRRAGERFDLLNTDPRPHPGAIRLLRALEASGVPWAIATSSRAAQVAVSLAALETEPGDHIVGGASVAEPKPAPDILYRAAEQLGVPARSCWYVGDATWDMRAAKAAAMPGVGVPSGAVGAEALAAAGAAVIVGSLDELADDLGRRGLVTTDP
jgi:HAD superfamily hydrolase (TIGR01509 family)